MSTSLQAYAELKRRVRQTLMTGQKKIERVKVQTYWETGRLIHLHTLANKHRQDYGQKVLIRLGEDLEISETILRRTCQFYKAFPIHAARHELSWAHFREILPIKEEKTRLQFLAQAEEDNWTSRELRQKVQSELKSEVSESKNLVSLKPLKTKLGTLYTYRLSKSISGETKIDLGFSIYRSGSASFANRKPDGIVESRKNKTGHYSAVSSKRGSEALFTYRAVVERVIDGDTLFAEIDLGFETFTRQYLRLRAVNAPEMDAGGAKAKEFVASLLKNVPFIFLTSTHSDKYDRYLADIFIPGKTFLADWQKGEAQLKTSSDLLHLNAELLTKNLAVRM